MTVLNEANVMGALSKVIDPELRRDIVALGMVRDLSIEDGVVRFTLALTVPECPVRDQLAAQARQAVSALPGVKSVEVTLGEMTAEERAEAMGKGGPVGKAAAGNRIGRVIAIMSGKGGVGKSAVAGLLASALLRMGYRVGVLDADITGPSIPNLFGLHGPLSGGPEGIEPAQSAGGIKLVSINFLLEDETEAVIWRGPIISGAIQQFWGDVRWGELDYLLVDLPPGTSDAALTVMQNLPVSGILMVTTPQALSSLIVRKAVRMAQVVGAPVVGVVENMAWFVAPDTGNRYEIFGPSHAHEVAVQAGVPLLARLPIDGELAARCDRGEVEQIDRPEIRDLAEALVRLLPVAAARQGS